MSCYWGTPAILAGAIVAGVSGEFVDGIGVKAIRFAVVAVILWVLARLATVGVLSSERGLVVRNPLHTHWVAREDIESVRIRGWIYRWSEIKTRYGKTVPVAASFFVWPSAGKCDELYKLLEQYMVGR